jgi:hypothetical protein
MEGADCLSQGSSSGETITEIEPLDDPNEDEKLEIEFVAPESENVINETEVNEDAEEAVEEIESNNKGTA